CCFSTISLSLSSSLFPYTTLFRSQYVGVITIYRQHTFGVYFFLIVIRDQITCFARGDVNAFQSAVFQRYQQFAFIVRIDCKYVRSEEHTSELQSRENLVCRLLLEK